MSPASTTNQRERAAPGGEVVFADVLCAVDGTRGSLAAVKQAAVLAGPEGRLTLLAVTAVAGEGAYSYAAISPARAERLLAKAATLAQSAGVRTTTVVDPAGPAWRVIVERAAAHDLLALGAPVTSWLGALFADGVAVKTLGSFTTPMLAARAIPGGRNFGRRILVASDGSAHSESVVALAGRVARRLGAQLTLLHAVGVESHAGALPTERQAGALEFAVGGAVQTRVDADAPHRAIVAAARDAKASLIVMGSRRLEGLHAVGSVSRRVVHEAHCSVLLVPPEGSR